MAFHLIWLSSSRLHRKSHITFSAIQTKNEPTDLQTGLCKPFPFWLFLTCHGRGSADGPWTIKICCLHQEQLLKPFHASCPQWWGPDGGLGGSRSRLHHSVGTWQVEDGATSNSNTVDCFSASTHGLACPPSVWPWRSPSFRSGGEEQALTVPFLLSEPLTLLCRDKILHVLAAQKEAVTQKMACP